VAGVLDEMRRAIESEDLDALRRTWIGLSAGDADSFHKWFERVREIHVRYDVLSAEPAGDRIVAKLQTRYEAFNESVNKREDQSFRQVLELEPRGGRWVVVASR
jgi:hypothetical protein